MTIPGLPLQLGSTGEPVADLHRRLSAAGFSAATVDRRVFCDVTEASVAAFQTDRKIEVDGVVDDATWSALVEAGYELGDRRLYHRSPMMRGDDVADLQLQLGSLGFDAGWVDGIFGPDTAAALIDFQRNAGLGIDGIAGVDTYRSLKRLGAKSARTTTIASLREFEQLTGHDGLRGRRIAVGEQEGLAPLVHALCRLLRTKGAEVLELHQPDPLVQALAANEFGAEMFLGLTIVADEGCSAHFFSTTGFESAGGRRLAEGISQALPPLLNNSIGITEGRRDPLLRGTRMPAVECRIGPPNLVVQRISELSTMLLQVIEDWISEPFTDG